jgi:epidermal growth factor receptor substrate 15
VAVHMPDIGSNPNSNDALPPNTASMGSSSGDSFLALLAQAADNSGATASNDELIPSSVATSKTRLAASTGATARPASKPSVTTSEASVSHSNLHISAKVSDTKPSPAKTDNGSATVLTQFATAIQPVNSLRVSPVAFPIATTSALAETADLSKPETTYISTSKLSTSATLPIPAASSTPGTASLPTVEAKPILPAGTSTTGSTAILPAHPSVTPRTTSVATPVDSNEIPSRTTESLHEKFSSPTVPFAPKETAAHAETGAPTSTAPGDAGEYDDDGQVGIQGATTSDNLVPDVVAADPGQASTTSAAVTSAIHNYISSSLAANLAHRQNVPASDVATKSDSGSAPVRHSDPEPTYTTGTHPESKPMITLPTDTNLSSQHSPSVKEAAKTDEHPATVAAHLPIGSDRPSQTPMANSSGHGARHDDSNASQSSSSDLKATQQAGGNPMADARPTFSDTMASKVVGIIPTKEAGVTTAPSTPVSQTAEAARTQTSTAEADYSNQQPVPATPLGTIHSAKLVAQAAQSELRVGFHAGEFGNVDIRTSMVRSQLTAEISVEHGELRNLLAVELPHLETKLAAHPFTATNIALNSHTGGGSSNSKQAYQQNAQGSQSTASKSVEQQSAPGLTAVAESQLSTTQLDVHF